MAAPSVIVKGTAAASMTGLIQPTFPTGILVNDIIYILAISNQPNGIGVIQLPNGFTEVGQGTYQNIDGDRGRIALFWKRSADGSESGATYSVLRTGDTGNDTVFFAQSYIVRDCITTGNPWDDTIARYTIVDDLFTTAQWGAVTVSGSERTLLAFYAGADNGSTLAPPTNYVATVTRDTTPTGTDAQVALFDRANVSSDGAVNSTTAETEGWATFHISAKPVPGETPVNQTALSTWEALQSLARLAVQPWTARGFLARTSAVPWTALQSVSRDHTQPWESLLGAERTGQGIWEALGFLSPLRSPVWESFGMVSRSQDMPWESLLALVRQGAMPWESLLLMVQAEAMTWEAVASVIRQADVPLETTGPSLR